MKRNLFKAIGTALAILGLVALPIISVWAANTSVSPTQASYNVVVGTNAVNIQQVTVANASAATMTVQLYDSPNTNTTYTRAAYTNVLSYTTNLVTVFTNFSGVIQTNTNYVLYTYSSVAPATTNNYRLLTTLTVPAGQTLTWTPSGSDGIYANFGVNAYASTNGTITLQYNSAY